MILTMSRIAVPASTMPLRVMEMIPQRLDALYRGRPRNLQGEPETGRKDAPNSGTSLMNLPFTPLVETLPSTVPFVGPETMERRTGQKFRARIGANENVFGPSPKVVAVMQEAA